MVGGNEVNIVIMHEILYQWNFKKEKKPWNVGEGGKMGTLTHCW